MDANELRTIWVEFFRERGHVLVPPASLIPTHPTAPLFTNSGMMQFVPYFLREEQPPWPRAQSIQKCVRIAGKHNDVDELGKTRRHLSFFEMLGNWSFGDYFKEDAIKWAWELVTEKIGMDGDRIWPTVHISDDEAAAIWHDTIGIPTERIQRLGKDNFWEMGATGPCGPCSELHFDCGPAWGAEGGPEHGDSDRFVEFWNLVFMDQFRAEDGSLSPLPNKNIDTGGGLERFLMLLEGVETVYDTQAVRPLIEVVESLSGKTYRSGDPRTDVAMRILADHSRTMAFLVNDGIPPSNEERGYVVRSVVRRAITRGQQLGIERPFLAELIRATIDHMGEAYPDLRASADGVIATLEREEHRFRQTLAQGSSLLEEELAKGAVSGEAAFKLHDTYGFPIDVTREIAEERGLEIDLAGFEREMTAQRTRAKAARKAGVIDKDALETYRAIVGEHGTTEFTGREENESKATVVAVLPLDDGTVEVFLDRTPFYAEAGGQIGDTGTITTDTGRADVLDTTFAVPGLHRHLARVVDGAIEVGQDATATIDAARRDAIRRNHTGTHLLHWALRNVVGDHVKQQGSLVAPDYLRFDFSHYEGLTPEQLREVEDLANAEVLRNDPVKHYETTRDHAAEIGAIAFFGDKYGEVVRVLEAGPSTELCGGTHVRATGDIGPIRITSEGSIGANQRRIFATTGTGTLERLRTSEETLSRAASLLNVGGADEVLAGVERLRDEAKALREELKALRKQAAGAGASSLADQAVDGIVVARVDGTSREELRDLAVAVRDRPGVRAVVLVGEPDTGGVALVAATRKGEGLDAGALIADAARAVGGGGGKDPALATAGGKDASKIDEALELARAAARQ